MPQRESFLVDPTNKAPENFDFYIQRQFDRFIGFLKTGGTTLPWGAIDGSLVNQADLYKELRGGGDFIWDEGDSAGVGEKLIFDDNGVDG